MGTSKQTGLTDELLSKLNEEDRRFCAPVIQELLELGYRPRKHKKSSFVIAFAKYGRIIAKFEAEQDGLFRFHMRYSACTSYPELFVQAAKHRCAAWVKRGQYWENQDVEKCCGCCKGHPRLYHVVQDNGTEVDICGGFTRQIFGVTPQDVPDVLRMLREQDRYFEETFS